jgi:DNA-binding XRE family transcriptional regulator
MVNEDAALLNRRVTHMTPAALFSRRLQGMNGEKLKCGKLKAEIPARTGHQRSEAGGQKTVAPADVMLNKKELAPKLKVSVRTIENWQHEGYLPFIKVANVVIFYWPTVLTHLQTHFSVSPRGVFSPQNKN